MELSRELRRALRALRALDGPSLGEWAARTGVAYSTIMRRRDRLAALGLVTWRPGVHRSYRLTKRGLGVLGNGGGDA